MMIPTKLVSGTKCICTLFKCVFLLSKVASVVKFGPLRSKTCLVISVKLCPSSGVVAPQLLPDSYMSMYKLWIEFVL